jgi:hypothetical protein
MVRSTDHTSNPAIIIDPISTQLATFSQSANSTPSPRTPSPSPVAASEDATGSMTDADVPPPEFNTGRRVKQRHNKIDELLGLLTEHAEDSRNAREESQKRFSNIEDAFAEAQQDQKRITEALTTVLIKLAEKL